MLNTNTRPLRRLPDLSWSGGVQHSVCEFCAIQEQCSVGAGRPLVCNDTVPALSFTDETGLSHLANTFRVGAAWMSRLRVGDTIGLYNTKAAQVFGYASVLFVEAGPIGRILKAHAHANHLMLDRPRENAARDLCDWLRRNYGPRIIHPSAKLTAIYLLREHEPPAAPRLEGLQEICGDPPSLEGTRESDSPPLPHQP